jgi:O-antigen ligase
LIGGVRAEAFSTLGDGSVTAQVDTLARPSNRVLAPLVCAVATLIVAATVASGREVVALGLLGAALYGMYFLREPALALLAYAATRPVIDVFVSVPIGPISVGQAWGAGLLLVLAAFLVRIMLLSRAGTRVPRTLTLLVVAYTLFALRGDTALALDYAPKLAAWLLLIVAVEWIARTRTGQEACFRAGYAVAIGSAIVIAIAIARNKYGATYYDTFAQGFEQGPHGFAFLALLSISFPLVALLQRRWYALSLALVGVLAIEITLSYVRTALIALALLAVAYFFIAVRRRSPSALALAAAAAGSAYFVQDQLASRLADLQLLSSGDPSQAGSGRVAIWTSVWDGTVDSVQNVLFGAGAGASNELVAQAIGHFVYAHNDFLEFFATGGLPLVAVYVAFIVWTAASARRLHRDPLQTNRARAVGAIALGAVAAFVTLSFLNSIVFYAASIEFALLLGLVRGMAGTPGRTCFDPAESE